MSFLRCIIDMRQVAKLVLLFVLFILIFWFWSYKVYISNCEDEYANFFKTKYVRSYHTFHKDWPKSLDQVGAFLSKKADTDIATVGHIRSGTEILQKTNEQARPYIEVETANYSKYKAVIRFRWFCGGTDSVDMTVEDLKARLD